MTENTSCSLCVNWQALPQNDPFDGFGFCRAALTREEAVERNLDSLTRQRAIVMTTVPATNGFLLTGQSFSCIAFNPGEQSPIDDEVLRRYMELIE